MNETIELQRVINIVLRRWRLLAVIVALAAALGYTISQQQMPVYQATTTLLAGEIINATDLNRQDILASDLMALTYKEMIRRQPVLQGVVDSLNLDKSWQSLKKQIRVELVEGTQLLQITAEAGSPESAEVIADEVARQLIRYSPTVFQSGENEEIHQFVQEHLNNLQARIEAGQSRLATLESELLVAESTERISEIEAEVNALASLLTEWENTYTQLLTFLQSRQSPSTLTVIEPAQANPKPIRPQPQLYILVGVGVAIFLGFGLIFLLEYLDDTLKTPEDIAMEFGLPVIGFISETRESGRDKKGIYVAKFPHSFIAEAYRSLRANLEFVGIDRPLKKILVTSCDKGVGKTSVAANLAMILAQSEKSVVLVDADLRKSSIHDIVDLPRDVGLSDIFLNGMNISKALKNYDEGRVRVLTGGTPPPNPSELLGSEKMNQILARLEKNNNYVILDSPPFAVSDALFLSTKVDGVLLVMQPGVTRKRFVKPMLDQLNRAGARVVGVVLNRIPPKSTEQFIGLPYSSAYYTYVQDSGNEENKTNKKRANFRILNRSLTIGWRFIKSVTGIFKARFSGLRRKAPEETPFPLEDEIVTSRARLDDLEKQPSSPQSDVEVGSGHLIPGEEQASLPSTNNLVEMSDGHLESTKEQTDVIPSKTVEKKRRPVGMVSKKQGDLTEDQWRRIRPLLPAMKGVRVRETRKVLNGIAWYLKSRKPWQELPERYGDWKMVSDQYRSWREDGNWVRISRILKEKQNE